jgi:type IV fimbrial biogenesis protein FimT
MVTVAVMVILGMMAAPALQNYLARAGVQSLQNDFITTMNRARGEAMSRNTCVSVCQLSVGANGAMACENVAAAAGQWHKGWILFANPSCTQLSATTNLPAADDTVLQIRQPGSARFELKDDDSPPELAFSYNAMGVLLANAASLSLTDQRDPASPYARSLVVNMQGRVMASAAITPTASGDDEEDEAPPVTPKAE